MSEELENFLKTKYVDDSMINQCEPHQVSLCTPMYNSEPFLLAYLQAVTSLDYPKGLMSLYFTIQGDDDTFHIMKDFQSRFKGDYRNIRVERVEQIKDVKIPHIQNVVKCRNLMVKWSDPDPVFFIDHDNFPPPNTLRRLQQDLDLGASMAAGVYLFYKQNNDNPNHDGMINFTAFFLMNGKMGSLGLNERGLEGVLPASIFDKRMWVDSVAMGSTLVKRELLNEYQFIVPEKYDMSDDTAYCMQASRTGHRFIADFGLLIPHWGYDLEITSLKNKNLVHLRVSITNDMTLRRKKMHEEGIYIR